MIEFFDVKKCDLFGVVLYLFGSSSFKGIPCFAWPEAR